MAATGILASSTPTESDVQQLGRVYDLLTADETTNPVPRHYLVGGGSHDPVEVVGVRTHERDVRRTRHADPTVYG